MFSLYFLFFSTTDARFQLINLLSCENFIISIENATKLLFIYFGSTMSHADQHFESNIDRTNKIFVIG